MNLTNRSKRNAETQSPGDEVPSAESATEDAGEDAAATGLEPEATEAPEADAAEGIAIEQDEPQEPEPLGDDASPTDLAEAAGQYRRVAAARRDLAERDRAEASRRLVSARAAEAEATRTRVKAEQRARLMAGPPGGLTHPADQEASELEARARTLMAAAGRQSGAQEAEQQARSLMGERGQLGGQVTEFDSRLARLDGERQAADGQLATARAADDIDAITALLGRIGAIEDQAAGISAQRQAAASRLEAIGDGEGPGELVDALRTAVKLHAEARSGMNAGWPGRPEAVQDKAAADRRAIFEAVGERLGEAAARQLDVPRTVVMTNRR